MAEPMFPKEQPGAPSKVTPEQKAEVLEAYREYVMNTDDPTIADFVTSTQVCWDYNILDHNIEQWPEFTDLKKRAQKKQEAFLLKQGGAGKYNPTLAIFRLKQPQHGYRDRIDTDITSQGERIGVPVSDEQLAQLAAARAERSNT